MIVEKLEQDRVGRGNSQSFGYKQSKAVLLYGLGLFIKSMETSEGGEVDHFKSLQPCLADSCSLGMNRIRGQFSNINHDSSTDY